MIRLDISYFYRLGMMITTLRRATVGQALSEIWLDLYNLQQQAEEIIHNTVVSGALRGTNGPAINLVRLIQTYVDREWESDFTAEDRGALTNALNAFEIVLVSELAVLDAYYVQDKKCLNTLKLVTEGELLFPSSVAAKAPQAIPDLREAGKCLAFEMPTAAGFHIMRAVEAILRGYWAVVTGNAPKPKQRSIGVYLVALTKLNCGDPKVIAALTQMKDLHRNVIIHPEETLDMDEAIALLGISNSVSAVMLKVMPELEPTQPSLNLVPPQAEGLDV